jgi:chromosome partitioning protein
VHIIVVTNPKGGVGKTTVSLNLAASCALANYRVLLIDLDPNGALSSSLGIEPSSITSGLYEIFLGTSEWVNAVYHFHLSRLDIIPSNIFSSEREARLTIQSKNRAILKRKINDAVLKGSLNYDFILIDTPPLLNDLTLGALLAAHSVIIPLQCSFYAFTAVDRLLNMIQRIRDSGNHQLRVLGIVLNFFEKHTKASRRGAEEARKKYREMIFDTVIPKNTTISYAAFEKKPVALIDITASGSVAFLQLTDEILMKISSASNRSLKTIQ